MKIKGTCGNCGRELLAGQAIDNGGHCPWCGKVFNRDYTATLVRALQEAEVFGNALQASLEQIAAMELSLEIDEDSVLEPLREALRATRRHALRV